MGRWLGIVAVLVCLLPAAARADYPHGPGIAPVESPQLGPVDVCNEMIAAARDRHYDDLIAHTSIYARERIGFIDKLLLQLARPRLMRSHCVRVEQQEDGRTLVRMSTRDGKTAAMPFVKEEGVWRFDQKRWEELRGEGRAPVP